MYMHRAVWEHHHGPIPQGMCVHHKDHDRANNCLDNLELLHKGEHAVLHGNHRAEHHRDDLLKHMREVMHPAAAAWHGSEEGRAWHREHGKRVWDEQVPVALVCTHCSKEYNGYKARTKRGFCSPVCQSAARRASGVDDEQRTCLACGESFTTNKYSKARHCSISCSAATRRNRASSGVRPDGGG